MATKEQTNDQPEWAIKSIGGSMIGYKDRTYCGSDVEVHTCGREFTEQDAQEAEKWWGGKDYPVAYMKFCEEEPNGN